MWNVERLFIVTAAENLVNLLIAAFLQSVRPPSAQGKNRFRTSCLLLCCSSKLESYTCRH